MTEDIEFISKKMKIKDIAKKMNMSLHYISLFHSLALEMFHYQYLSEAGRTHPEEQGAESFMIVQ